MASLTQDAEGGSKIWEDRLSSAACGGCYDACIIQVSGKTFWPRKLRAEKTGYSGTPGLREIRPKLVQKGRLNGKHIL